MPDFEKAKAHNNSFLYISMPKKINDKHTVIAQAIFTHKGNYKLVLQSLQHHNTKRKRNKTSKALLKYK